MRTSSNVLNDFVQNIPEICIPPKPKETIQKTDYQDLILSNLKLISGASLTPGNIQELIKKITAEAVSIQADDPEVWEMLRKLEMQAEGLEA